MLAWTAKGTAEDGLWRLSDPWVDGIYIGPHPSGCSEEHSLLIPESVVRFRELIRTDKATQLELAMSTVCTNLPCLAPWRTFASVILNLSLLNVEGELLFKAAVLSTARLALTRVFLGCTYCIQPRRKGPRSLHTALTCLLWVPSY